MGELREFILRAQRDPTTEAIEALWSRVYRLQAWYLLPSKDIEGPSTPLVGKIDGSYWVLCFSNVRRLVEFATKVGRRDENDEIRMLVLDPPTAMQELWKVRASIAGVVFNVGTDEVFRAPTAALEQYADHFEIPWRVEESP